MSKTIDFAATGFVVFILLLIWLDYLTDSFIGAVILGFLLTLVLSVIWQTAKSKSKIKKYPKRTFYTQLALMGNCYTANLFAKANGLGATEENYIYSSNKLFFVSFGFFGATEVEIAAAFRKAREFSTSNVTFICRAASRGAQLLAAQLPCNMDFIFADDLFKLLKRSDTLPPLMEFQNSSLPKNGFKSILSTAFVPENAKYYMFSGFILSALTFLTPLKLYYVIMATISLVFAVICKIRR